MGHLGTYVSHRTGTVNAKFVRATAEHYMTWGGEDLQRIAVVFPHDLSNWGLWLPQTQR